MTTDVQVTRQTLTIKTRLKDKHASELCRMARAVNYVWNYCNETQQKAARARRKWMSAYDLQKLTNGASKDLNLHAHTIQRVCSTYATSRQTHKKPWLRWRGRKSLGWVPFNTGHVTFDGACFTFRGAVEAPRLYRASEAKLAVAQRARRTPKRIRNIHAKIANRRKDYLHKASAKIAKEFGAIVIGDVSSKTLAQTKMAKSVLDAGWSIFKSMLTYKAIRHGGRVVEVNERYTSQTCSECGSLPPSRPKGIAGLGIREWRCDDCETVHDRDVNAARNILRVGTHALAEGAPAFGERS